MVLAELTKIQTDHDLKNDTSENYLVFLLPTGDEVRARVDDDVLTNLLQMEEAQEEEAPKDHSAVFYEKAVAPPPPPTDEPEGEEEPPDELVERPVDWGKLADNALPPHVKQAMRAVNVPPVLPLSQVYATMNRIMDEFTEDDWAKVLGTVSDYTSPPPQPVGQVQWGDAHPSPPIVGGPKIQADEQGNPIPTSRGNDVDPGEIVGDGETDEDGVASF